LKISQVQITGQYFSVIEPVNLPVSLAGGATYDLTLRFHPGTAGAAAGTLTLTSSSAPGGKATVSLTGTGEAAPGQTAPGVLSGISCRSGALTGTGTDSCTVSLSAAAGAGGLAVKLSSNNAAVVVPANVSVTAGSAGAAFTASAAAVSIAQTAKLTATAGNVSETYALALNPAVPGLTLSSKTVAFGGVALHTPATQSVTVTSSGGAALAITGASVTGTGFSMPSVRMPLTVSAGQTATLDVEFNPSVTGAAAGTLTLNSNAASGGAATIGLTGTGEVADLNVALSWDAPTNSTDPIAGYRVYRALRGAGSLEQLDASTSTATTYVDTSVVSGTSYDYYVTCVDAWGNESAPSNVFSVTVW
jgi:hypothetical protein